MWGSAIFCPKGLALALIKYGQPASACPLCSKYLPRPTDFRNSKNVFRATSLYLDWQSPPKQDSVLLVDSPLTANPASLRPTLICIRKALAFPAQPILRHDEHFAVTFHSIQLIEQFPYSPKSWTPTVDTSSRWNESKIFRLEFGFNFGSKLRRNFQRTHFGDERSGEPGEKDRKGARRSASRESSTRRRFEVSELQVSCEDREGAFSTDSHTRSLRQGINRVGGHAISACMVSLEDLVRNQNQSVCRCLRDY